jgi:hypothetical protein
VRERKAENLASFLGIRNWWNDLRTLILRYSLGEPLLNMNIMRNTNIFLWSDEFMVAYFGTGFEPRNGFVIVSESRKKKKKKEKKKKMNGYLILKPHLSMEE